jgi:hypothetical protein
VIYSIYNYGTRSYDYYQGGEVGGTHAPIPPKGKGGVPGMGLTADAAAWPLPAGAKKIGTGAEARGRIAKITSSVGALGDIQDGLEEGLVMAAAAIALLVLLSSSKKASTP